MRRADSVAIARPDKVLFPKDGYTKRDLVDYYRRVSPWLLPYLRERPLTFQRWPDGIEGPSFFTKSAPRGTPPWVRTVPLPSKGGEKIVDYVVCNDEATLTWAAGLATITFHVWYSRIGSLGCPDYLLFDLDPSERCTVGTLARVALRVRDHVAPLGLSPLVKSTGKMGLHVVVPVVPRSGYELAKGLVHLVARRIAQEAPREVTLERSLAKRPRGTVYVDWAQVGRGKTIVPPFVVRARDGAPVSMPLAWEELERVERSRATDTARELGRYTIANAPGHLDQYGDRWRASWKAGDLEDALARARRVWGDGQASEAPDTRPDTRRRGKGSWRTRSGAERSTSGS